MEVRLATLDDIEPICILYHEFWQYNADLQPMYYKAGTENGGYPKSVITSEKADIIIAVEKNIIVGFIHIREAQTPPFDAFVRYNYAEIIDFITTVNHREKGIGSELLGAAKQWAKERNLDYIELFVLSDAEDEFRFYENRDFVTVSHTMRCLL